MSRRILKSIFPWFLAVVLLSVVLIAIVPPEKQYFAINIVGLLGVISLAVPTIRVNEQGKRIERIRTIQVGIETLERQLGNDNQISDQNRASLTDDLLQRKNNLEESLQELSAGKGAWSPAVHYFLYCGYVLVLGAFMVRVVIAA